MLIANKLQDLTKKSKCVIEYDTNYDIVAVYTSGSFDESLAYQLIELNKEKGHETVIENVYFHNTDKVDKVLVVYDYDSGTAFCLFTDNLEQYKQIKPSSPNGEPVRYHLIDAINLNENLVKSKVGITKYDL